MIFGKWDERAFARTSAPAVPTVPAIPAAVVPVPPVSSALVETKPTQP
jgi:hypothetical protein